MSLLKLQAKKLPPKIAIFDWIKIKGENWHFWKPFQMFQQIRSW